MDDFNYDFIVALYEYFQRIRKVEIEWVFLEDIERAFFNYKDDKWMIMDDILSIYNKTHNEKFILRERIKMNLLIGLFKAGMGKPWKALGIRDDLSQLQKLVDGYIETVDLPYNGVLIVNEEGLINGMHYNTTIGGLQVFGPCLILGRKGEEFCDAPEEYVLLLEGQTNDKRKQK